jgi:serine/threonine protein kinase
MSAWWMAAMAWHGRLPEPMAAKFVWQLLDAIEYCHSIDIVHRDLKPENIFLDSTSKETSKVNIKVGDFGTARLVGSAGRMQTRAGTPQYLAPEVDMENKSGYGKECDLWSIGCKYRSTLRALLRPDSRCLTL